MFSTTASITHDVFRNHQRTGPKLNRSRHNPVDDLNKVRGRRLALGSEPWFLVVLILSIPSANFHVRDWLAG